MGGLLFAAKSLACDEIDTSTAGLLGPPLALGVTAPACSAGLAAPTLETPPR
jgi:hypothetical protein